MRAPLLVLLACVALVPWPAVADHPQTVLGGQLIFDHKGGNEWWVQVRVLVSGPFVTKVDAMDTGGDWKPLQLKSWGDWAASFHVEPGHEVRFRATLSNGHVEESCWFSHPAGVERCEDEPPPPPPGEFSATFDGAKGNEWWIEVRVTANQPLAGVDARVNSGSWIPLSLKSWGAWAKSIHAPDGSIVHFRARSTGGGEDVAPTCYRWTAATPVECDGTVPPPSDFDATFSSVKGNEWWVEVKVSANKAIAGVDFRTDSELTWRPLTKRSWGAWAASFHFRDHDVVQFRARSTSGDVDLSGCWEWFDVVPVTCERLFPSPGDYAKYRLVSTSDWTDHAETMWVNVSLEVREMPGGWSWTGTCSWHRRIVTPEGTDHSTGVIVLEDDVTPISMQTESIEPGSVVGVAIRDGCGSTSFAEAAVVDGPLTRTVTVHGRSRSVEAWDGDASATWEGPHLDVDWVTSDLGLVVNWNVAWTDPETGIARSSVGRLVDTSAPL